MKRIYLILATFIMLFSCQDDDKIIFNADPSEVEITFQSFPGGAYLSYKLPDNSEIFGIKAQYETDRGKDITVEGTYLSSRLELSGFVDQVSDVPVKICLLDHNGAETKSIIKNFSVQKCAANSFFENAEVLPYWNGFQVKYECPQKSNGFFHIGYIAKNITTNKLDTILLKTLPIVPGKGAELFSEIVDTEVNKSTVVIWTEDFKGNFVDKKIYKDVPAALAEIADPSNFTTEGSIIYDYSWYGVGREYLFDGDTKGTLAYKAANRKDYVFYVRDCEGASFMIDLQEPKNLAFVKIYAPLNTNREWSSNANYGEYRARIPNDVIIYGSNDKYATTDQWKELGRFYQPASTPIPNRWIARLLDQAYLLESMEEIDAAEPIYTQINFEVSEDSYRYLRVKVNETFPGMSDFGEMTFNGEYMLQELEVYIKKSND